MKRILNNLWILRYLPAQKAIALALKSDPEPKVRYAAVHALMNFPPTPESKTMLEEARQDPIPEIAGAAHMVLEENYGAPLRKGGG